MTTANEKLRSIFLAALMVFSVFAGTIALSGAAAAANDPANLQFSANNGGSSITVVESSSTTTDITFDVDNLNDQNSGQNVEITVAAEDGVEFSSLNSVNGSTSSSAQVNNDGDIVFAVQPSSSNTDRTFLLSDVVVESPAVSGSEDFNLTVDVNETGDNTDSNTVFENAITVTDSSGQTGFLSGRISDQNNNDVPNATVTAVRSSDGLTFETTSNTDGDYTFELPSGFYNVTVEQDGFSTAEAVDQRVRSNQTTTSNLVIRRLLVPNTIEATPDSDEDIVGEVVRFDATVFDQDGNPLDGVDVTITTEDPVTFNGSGTNSTSATTDENGQLSVNVTSDAVTANADVTFTVDSNESVTDTSQVSFTESGEAEISGTVLDQSTTNPIEDASVWAVRASQYESNQFHTVVNTTSLELGDDDDTVFLRLVDNETDAIIDNDEYDIRAEAYSNSSGPVAAEDGTAVRKIAELNESDAQVGSGYALIDANGDGRISFTHTRIQDREYYAQVSVDAENSSDERVADTGREAFVNVSGVAGDGVTVNSLGTTPAVFAPTANLTLDNTIERAEVSNANQVDSPGFINYYGVDTQGTNENGQWGLNRLSSNFQQGTQYVVIATKTGFETEFKDVVATEDGQLTFEQTTGSNDIQLLPEDVEPDGVNITQIGTRENAEADTVEFENQSDDFAQQVPRDGSTVDVFQVDTTAEDTPINASVDLTIENASVNGSFIDVEGGDLVANDSANNTATIVTGEDGTALVLYKTDEGTSDILTNKTAVLGNDASATDNSTVLFLGTINFDTGSVSGIVTNEDNEPIIDSVVYVAEFETQNGTTFTIEPVENIDETNRQGVLESNFTITDQSSGENVTVTGAELAEFDFEGNFTRVSVDGVESTTLLTFPSEEQGQAQYTLPRVPAQDPNGVDYNRVVGTELDSGISGVGDTDSPVQIDFTQEANVVIRGAVPTNGTFTVSNLSAPAAVDAGEEFDVTANVTNEDVVTATQDVEFRVSTGALTGDTTVVTQEVTLGPGESTTVEFSDLSLDEGDYNHGVFTADDSQTATIEVGTVGDDPDGVVDQYDTNDDGEISLGELGVAASDFSNDDLSLQDLSLVAAAYSNS